MISFMFDLLCHMNAKGHQSNSLIYSGPNKQGLDAFVALCTFSCLSTDVRRHLSPLWHNKSNIKLNIAQLKPNGLESLVFGLLLRIFDLAMWQIYRCIWTTWRNDNVIHCTTFSVQKHNVVLVTCKCYYSSRPNDQDKSSKVYYDDCVFQSILIIIYCLICVYKNWAWRVK